MLRLKNKTFLFFLFLTIAIVVIVSVVYVVFFLPSGLSSAETANRLNNIYSQTQIILSNMSVNINNYVSQGINNSTFSTHMVNLKTDMVALRTELTEIRKVAFPTYTRSIDLLDLGLQWYIDALDYAQRFDFNSSSQCLQWGTEDIIQSTHVLPKS